MKQTNINNIPITTLVKDIENCRINLNPHYQRARGQWTIEQQSLFIHSIFANYPIPPLYFYANDEGVNDVFDGIQRISTILNFLHNDLKLHKNTPNYAYSERFRDGLKEGILELSHKTYTDLINETDQNLIETLFNDKTISYFKISDCSEDEQAEIFLRLNNGTKMSNAQKTLAAVGKNNATIIKDISSSPIFLKYSDIQKSQKTKGETANIIIILAMLFSDYPCPKFDPAQLSAFSKGVKTNTIENNYSEVQNILTEFSLALEKKHGKIKNFRKWQIITMSYCFKIIKEQGGDTVAFTDWMAEFLINQPKKSDYLDTKNIKSPSVLKRKINDTLNEFHKFKGV